MRIVHVSDCFLPRIGGIETQVADLVRHQTADGHEVSVLTGTAGAVDEDVRVHRIPAGPARGILLGTCRGIRAVADLRPDVVHCHSSVLSPLAVSVAAAVSDIGVPTAVTVHSLLPSIGPLLPLSGALLGVRGRRVAWSAVSEVAAVPVRRLLGSVAQVTVLPNAVDVAWWRAADPPPVTPTRHEVRIVSVGRMAIRKRPMALVRMIAQIRRLAPDGPAVRLVLVGDGPRRPGVERLVRDLGLGESVELPGQLGRDEVRDVYSGADIYVAPATLESFGIAALEARCVGLPIVAKVRGGVGDFVAHGTEGILADTDKDMVRALTRLVTSATSRATIRQHNRHAVPSFDWNAALRRTAELYARAEALVGQPAIHGRSATTAVADLQGAS